MRKFICSALKLSAISIVAFIFLSACQSEKKTERTSENSATVPVSEAPVVENILIKNKKENENCELVLGNEISFEWKGNLYTSKLKGEKRKYYDSDNAQLAEVKIGDDGFKVRGPGGNLLWKIKISSTKIKISDNEENENPYEIKLGEGDKVKMKRNETEIGNSRIRQAEGKIEVSSGNLVFDVQNTSHPQVYNVLLIEEMPDLVKFIVIGELLRWE